MSEKFKYEYSAPTMEERKEISSIRDQYLPKGEKEQKLERLRKLDSKVKNIPLIWALSQGIIGSLIFGTSMTFFLEWTEFWYIGIPFSIVGFIVMISTYPIYVKILKHIKNKYKDEIINISNELLKEENLVK